MKEQKNNKVDNCIDRVIKLYSFAEFMFGAAMVIAYFYYPLWITLSCAGLFILSFIMELNAGKECERKQSQNNKQIDPFVEVIIVSLFAILSFVAMLVTGMALWQTFLAIVSAL